MSRSSRDRVVAEMRVAVDHAVAVERHVPGAEHVHRQLVALAPAMVALNSSSGLPCSQSMVSSRRVDSSGHHARARGCGSRRRASRGRGRDVGPPARSRAPRAAGPRSPRRSGWCRSRIVTAVRSKISRSCVRSASTAASMFGILQLAGDGAGHRAARPCAPAQRGGSRGSSGNEAKCFCQSGPSSAAIRRRTNGLPIGGALPAAAPVRRRTRRAGHPGWSRSAAPPSSAGP